MYHSWRLAKKKSHLILCGFSLSGSFPPFFFLRWQFLVLLVWCKVESVDSKWCIMVLKNRIVSWFTPCLVSPCLLWMWLFCFLFFFKLHFCVTTALKQYPNQSVNKYSVIVTPLAYKQVLVCLEVTLVDIKIGWFHKIIRQICVGFSFILPLTKTKTPIASLPPVSICIFTPF